MELGKVGLIIFVVVGVTCYLTYYFSRARTLLHQWVKTHDYMLLDAELRFFRRGPYFLSGRGHAIYRVEIIDDYGLKRKGWVRCGSWAGGIFTDKVEGVLES